MKLDDGARDALLGELAAMPQFLRQSFGSMDAGLATQPGPEGLFSPVEQVWHLADLEAEGFGVRIDRLLNEPHPQLPDFDGAAVAQARHYRSLSLSEGLERFESARRANIEKLKAVPDGAWTNAGTQAGVGEVSLCDMPVFLRQHDHAHRDEIGQWWLSLGAPAA